MILPAVPPYLTSPRLIARAAQDIQIGLYSNISWLNRSYHIAKVGINAESGLGYPQIYANDDSNNSYDLRPDNDMSAYSFIEIDRPYSRDEEAGEITYFMSVVFWGNLALIDTSKDYDYTSQLIKDASDALSGLGAENIIIEERPEFIFNKYSGINQELKQFLMRKYTSFKITFSYTTTYTDNCDPDPVDVCQLYVEKFESLSDADKTCVQAQICEVTPCEDATAVLKNTLGTTISTTSIGSGDSANIVAPVATAVLKDSANATISTTTIASGVSTNITAPDGVASNSDSTFSINVKSNGLANLPNITFIDSDGTSSSVPSVKNITATPQVKSLFLKALFDTGDDEMESITIDSDNAGTYTSISDDGGSGTITINKNSGGFVAFSNPLTLAVNDTLIIKRTVTTADGWVKMTGTYT